MWVTLSLRKKELKQEHAQYQLADLQLSRQKRQLDRRKRYEQALIQNNQKAALNPIKLAFQEKVAQLNKEKTALSQYIQALKSINSNSLGNYVLAGEKNNGVCMKSDSGEYIVAESDTQDGSTIEFIKISDTTQGQDGAYYDADGFMISTVDKSDGTAQKYTLAYDLSQYEDILSGHNLPTDLSTVSADDISMLESRANSEISNIQTEIQNAQTSRMEEENNEKLIWEDELQMLEEEVGEEETQLELEQNDIETQMEYISTELQAIGDAASNEIKNSVIKLS